MFHTSSARPSGNVVQINLSGVESKISYLRYKDSKERFVGVRFVIECAKKLNVDAVVSSTAACLFHQFYANVCKEAEHEYDQYVSCIVLSVEKLLQHNNFDLL
jgi:hypothetical protein